MSITKKRLYLFVTGLALSGLFWLYYNLQHVNAPTLCFIKNITGIPCPSCGVTRSILALFKGNILEAIWINPLGLIVMIFLLMLPVWVTHDIFFEKDGMYRIFLRLEALLAKPVTRNLFIILVLVNWGWNIIKHL